MQILNPQKAKLNMFCPLVDPHSLNPTCCRGRLAKLNNVGVVLVEVKGLDANVVLNLRDELLRRVASEMVELLAYSSASAELVAMTCWVLLLLCMLFFRKVTKDPNDDCLVLMSPAQSVSL